MPEESIKADGGGIIPAVKLHRNFQSIRYALTINLRRNYMLLYNTKIPVKEELSREKFIETFLEWINKSKNHPLNGISWSGEDELLAEAADEKLEILCHNETTAIHMANSSGGNLRTSDFILNAAGDTPSILAQTYGIGSIKNPELFLRLPSFLYQIYLQGLFGSDNGAEINKNPLVFSSADTEMAADMINNTNNCWLPIIYVSKTFYTKQELVSSKKLAAKLFGLAHVITETEPYIQRNLRKKTDGRNPYNGYIYIYYPNGIVQKICTDMGMSMEKTEDDICRRIYDWHICTCENDQPLFKELKYSIQYQKNKESEELIKLYESLLLEQDQKNKEAKEENRRLAGDLNRFMLKAEALEQQYINSEESEISGVKLNVSEKELYENELKDVILKVLKKEVDSMEGDANLSQCRKYHVLKNIVNNNDMTDFPEKTYEALKSLSGEIGYNQRDSKRHLANLGFTVHTGNHIKVCYKDDERYMFTIASSASDKRVAKNVTSSIYNVLFGY